MKNSKIILAFPSPLSQKDKEIHFIKLFEKLINSDTTSILFRQLREKQDLVYNITIEDSVHGYGSYILIKTQCENKDIIKVIRLCLEVLKNMSSGKLNKEKLKHIIELYLVEYYNTCKNGATKYCQEYCVGENGSNSKIQMSAQLKRTILFTNYTNYFIEKLCLEIAKKIFK